MKKLILVVLVSMLCAGCVAFVSRAGFNDGTTGVASELTNLNLSEAEAVYLADALTKLKPPKGRDLVFGIGVGNEGLKAAGERQLTLRGPNNWNLDKSGRGQVEAEQGGIYQVLGEAIGLKLANDARQAELDAARPPEPDRLDRFLDAIERLPRGAAIPQPSPTEP